ncbi:MAG: bifunctional 3-(3-hydroxy-phenyl)propionate/3-hydroxycinnamic acid hydroxylase [Pseudomonadota bacterium]
MQDPDVLVIGLGPVGAVFAALCAKQGLNVLVLERDSEIYKQPRAIVIDYEVMRQLNLIGCADGVLAHSKPSEGYHFVNQDWEILMKRDRPPVLAPTGYHFANLFHQPSMEHVVRMALAKLPNVDIMLETQFIAIEQDEDGVTATIRTPDGPRDVRSKYAIGCDGGSSLTRRYLDIQLEDLGFDEPWVVVDVKVPGGVEGLPKAGVQMCDPDRPTTCVPSGPGRHRWEFMLKEGETAEQVTRPESLKKWISKWIDPDLIELERSAVYQFHGLVAKQWRVGRIMIIGDAAHQTPPFMGQGLCAGVRDATNLAWKLGAVARGEAHPDLLDTLMSERSPHARAVIQGAIEMGKVVCVLDPAKAAERDRKMIADREAGLPYELPGVPNIEGGILDDEAAGKVFPEGFLDNDEEQRQRVDDLVGYVPLLIVNANQPSDNRCALMQKLKATSGDLRICSLGGKVENAIVIEDADGAIAKYLGDAEAMLVKPDRIIFGSGSIEKLTNSWAAYLQGEQYLRDDARDAA